VVLGLQGRYFTVLVPCFLLAVLGSGFDLHSKFVSSHLGLATFVLMALLFAFMLNAL
jgi:hypothetical protein